MTGLLVSVRSAAEAAAALAGGASVIDVKEPDRGALGAADPATWRSVLGAVAGRAPVSAALGELCAEGGGSRGVAALAAQTAGLAFAKVGLAEAARFPDWRARWSDTLVPLTKSVASVAVAYADWKHAGAPRPEEVIDAGAELGCSMLLMDTFAKERGHLLTHLSLDQLSQLSSRAQQVGLSVVLAGSLSAPSIRDVLPLAPALVAVRGAACRPDRRGTIDAALVRELAALVSPDASTIVGTPSRPRGALDFAKAGFDTTSVVGRGA